MSGIIFFKTKMLEKLKDFYTREIGCQIWLKQADCIIFKHDNLLFGFCQRDKADTDNMITFFFDSKKDVDSFYKKFKSVADSAPAFNKKYNIYQFFARDPEGRILEFQYFEHTIQNFRSGDELLLTRRSIRKFKDKTVPDELFNDVLNNSRFAPTSMNRQGYYFKVIRDRKILEFLAGTRGSSSKPIANGPLAVAICSDPNVTKRAIQDGCIAAYHFILAAWNYGLGTCWIAAMDRDDVKEILNIPKDHYIATITPVGFPDKFPIEIPSRNDLTWFLKE
jgi:nitroreductase